MENKKVVKIENKVVESVLEVHYEVVDTQGEVPQVSTPDKITDKTCKIWNLTPNGRKLVAKGKGYIGENCIPHIRIEMYQLPYLKAHSPKNSISTIHR